MTLRLELPKLHGQIQSNPLESVWSLFYRQSAVGGLERLRSVVGEREKWSAGGVTAGTEPERNAAADPQMEANAPAFSPVQDE
jgi:hypothetical protein